MAPVLGAFVVCLAGCAPGTPEPVAAPTATAPAAAPSVPAPDDDGRSVAALVARGNAAFRAGRLFEPREDNAFDLFTAALALSPDDPAAREALGDLFPLALARIESAIAAGDRADAERLLSALDAVLSDSPALAALRARLTAAPVPAPAPAIGEATAPTPVPPSVLPDTLPTTPALPVPAVATAPDSEVEAADTGADARVDAAAEPVSTDATETANAAATSEIDAVEPSVTRLNESPERTSGSASAAVTPPPTTPASTSAAADREARLVRRFAPDYPTLARQRGIAGWVDLEYVIGSDGRVVDVRVLASDPPRVFEVAAERALRRWQFEPASRGGTPTESVGRTRIEFSPG
jgi:protein TonB